MNLVMLLGRLTKDPEIRYTQGDQGTKVASFTLAVDRKFKKDGQPSADFIRCKAFGKTAEIVEQYAPKGKQVAITGEIQTGSYQKQDGTTVYTTDIICNQVQLLGSAEQVSKTKQHAQAPAPAPQPDPEPVPDWEQDDLEGDLPF